MAGTREGGIKAAKAAKKRYGRGHHKEIGAVGGNAGKGGGYLEGHPRRAKRIGKIGLEKRYKK